MSRICTLIRSIFLCFQHFVRRIKVERQKTRFSGQRNPPRPPSTSSGQALRLGSGQASKEGIKKPDAARPAEYSAGPCFMPEERSQGPPHPLFVSQCFQVVSVLFRAIGPRGARRGPAYGRKGHGSCRQRLFRPQGLCSRTLSRPLFYARGKGAGSHACPDGFSLRR